ncbi:MULTISPECIES: Sec-independent protein translocase protein TatB [Achromobacter]|uniref:Sec-independent protein translocase protein TatB n=1 Tax=Achromobacter sp. TaxID=134375 RepID=UPI002F9535DB
MFDVSFTELMVIGVIALIVIGPERLPKVARTVGHLLGRAQRYVNDVKSDIQREIELDELRKFKSEMEDAAQGVQQSLNETQASLQEPVQQFRAELDEVAREASIKGEPAAASDTPAEPERSIAPPPGQNHSLDLDLPPVAIPAPAATQPPAPSAPKADDAAPAAKPVAPSGTPT